MGRSKSCNCSCGGDSGGGPSPVYCKYSAYKCNDPDQQAVVRVNWSATNCNNPPAPFTNCKIVQDLDTGICWSLGQVSDSEPSVIISSLRCYENCNLCITSNNCPFYPCVPNGPILECPDGFTFSCLTCGCVEVGGGNTGACCKTRICFNQANQGVTWSECIAQNVTEQMCAAMGGNIWVKNKTCQQAGCLSQAPSECVGDGGGGVIE